MSTNTFHWIVDHEQLFRAISDVLEPGGRLLAVTGGSGSLLSVREAARRVGVLVDEVNTDATVDATERRLAAAGVTGVRCSLTPEPVRFGTRRALAAYLADAALAPDERGAELAAQVADELPEPVADFVRLTIAARKRDPRSQRGADPQPAR